MKKKKTNLSKELGDFCPCRLDRLYAITKLNEKYLEEHMQNIRRLHTINERLMFELRPYCGGKK